MGVPNDDILFVCILLHTLFVNKMDMLPYLLCDDAMYRT
jgi:hypothetical protein